MGRRVPTPADMPELLRVERVAQVLDCHPRTVRRMAREGRLKQVKLTKYAVRITRASVVALMHGDEDSNPS